MMVDIPGDRLAVKVGIGPAAAAGILRIEVRIAGQLLQLAVEKQLAELNPVEALRGNVGLQDRTAIRDETGNRPSAEICPLALGPTIDDRRFGRAGVGLAQVERFREEIRPATHDDRYAAGR